MKTPLLSIIILDYKKADRVVQNVKGVLGQKGKFDLEVIVVDNSASKKNAAVLQKLESDRVKVVINKKNVGYTKGNNIGAQYATGDYIVIVNPDIEWRRNDVLQTLLEYSLKHIDVGIIGPKQVNPDGSYALTMRTFPSIFVQMCRRTFLRALPGIQRLVRRDEMRDVDPDQKQEVDWLQSSFFFLKKSLWDDLGGFDEQFFLFLADTDMCWQVWKRGLKVIYLPEATVYADGVRCSQGGFAALATSWVMRQHLKDSWIYTWKYLDKKNPRK